jgi:hypothetical protein
MIRKNIDGFWNKVLFLHTSENPANIDSSWNKVQNRKNIEEQWNNFQESGSDFLQ